MRRTVTCAAMLGGALLVGGGDCDAPPPLPTFRVAFLATSDGAPLGGVQILADGRPVGATKADGSLRMRIRRPEGTAIAVSAQCPDGYRAADEIPLLRLRRVHAVTKAAEARGIEVTISCPPAERTAAVVVRANGIAGLPVRLLGREVARTDAMGTAHLAFNLRPPATFQLQLDTSGMPELQPQNPVATFNLGDSDQVFLYDQPFEKRERTRPHRPRPRPTKGPGPVQIPVRIN